MNKNQKEKNKIKNTLSLPIIIITIINGLFAILSIGTSYAAGEYLYDSKDIIYENKESKLMSSSVQGAIDELYSCATDFESYSNSVKSQVYPVGSIYISVSSTNPSTLFGGTWVAFGTGRTLVGMGSNGIDEYTTVAATGGSSTQTLQTKNLPSHNHAFTPAGSVSSSFTGTKKSTESAGSHSHTMSDAAAYYPGADDSLGGSYATRTSGGKVNQTNSAGSHSHYYTPEGSVSSSFTGTKGNTENTGSGTAFSTMDPYITVYMWKRTA